MDININGDEIETTLTLILVWKIIVNSDIL